MTKLVSQPIRVGEVIQRFLALGCTIHVAEATIEADDGDCFNVRYLRNDATGGMVAVIDLEDDQFIFPEAVEYWERRLGVTI